MKISDQASKLLFLAKGLLAMLLILAVIPSCCKDDDTVTPDPEEELTPEPETDPETDPEPEPEADPLEVVEFVNAAFKAAVLKIYDLNGDSEIDLDEAALVTEIDLDGLTGITTIEDIVNFQNLTKLICSSTAITALDISKNPALEYVDGRHTVIRSCDTSNNEALRVLLLSSTLVTGVDLTNNTALEVLDLSDTDISSLNLSKNTKLESLDVSGTDLKTLYVAYCPDLESLDVSDCDKLYMVSYNGTTQGRYDWVDEISKIYYNDITADDDSTNEGQAELDVVLPTIDPDSDATTPTSYTLILDGEEVTVGDGGSVDTGYLEAGEYTVYVYSNTDGIDMANNIAADGTIVSSTHIDALTEDLYFGTQTFTVLADEVISSDITLSQVTRTVQFNLTLTDVDPDGIKSVAATLSGIAQEWECVEDVPHGEPETIELGFVEVDVFTKTTDDYFTSCTVRVLGVHEDEDQHLTLTITYTDDTTQTIIIDLDDDFEDSNDTKSVPLLIKSTITIPVEGTMGDAAVGGWRTGTSGSQTVN